MIPTKETEEATNQILELLEDWGSQSKFIWFRELHRITDIDKGLLRNIINELKKQKRLKKCTELIIEYSFVLENTMSNAEI